MAFTTYVDSPIGPLRLVASNTGLQEVSFVKQDLRHPSKEQDDSHWVLQAAATQLGEYFAGVRREFDVPLELHGTEFQVAAWRALANIAYGETRAYKQQAIDIGRPKAVRAIGAANGKNPISVILPCHRVIGSNGSLVGYGGGLSVKEYLLNHEQTHLHIN